MDNSEDEGPPRKRLQSDHRGGSDQQGGQQSYSPEARIAELERELADANRRLTENRFIIRERDISLEAAIGMISQKERIIAEKERIISEKNTIIETLKQSSDNATTVGIMTAEKDHREKVKAMEKDHQEKVKAMEKDHQEKVKAMEKDHQEKVKALETKYREKANNRIREKVEEANRHLEAGQQREILLRNDLEKANQRFDQADWRVNKLINELSKAQSLHQQSKTEAKLMFGFLKTGKEALESFTRVTSRIADRKNDEITHLETVGKLLADDSKTISPFGVQVTREDPESQHLNGHVYTMVQGTQATIDAHSATTIGTFIETVDPDSEIYRFRRACENLLTLHPVAPFGFVFNVAWKEPYLEWTDASPGNLFSEEDVERVLRKLSEASDEQESLYKLTESVNRLSVSVPQDREQLKAETKRIESKLQPIMRWIKDNEDKITKIDMKRRYSV